MIVRELIELLEVVDEELDVMVLNNDGYHRELSHVNVEMSVRDEPVITISE